MADMIWFSPMIISALTAEQFFQIICAIMLEKSVIFVSDNLPLLSSSVLGLQCFLHPFKWSFVQIPILPRSLVDMIEAPMPFLVGLLRSHLKFVSLQSDYHEEGVERIVVYINDERKEVTVDNNHVDLPIPCFKNLVERLTIPFSVLNCSKHYVSVPTESQKVALLDIQRIVLSTFME